MLPLRSVSRGACLALTILTGIGPASGASASAGPTLTLTQARASGTLFQLVAGIPTLTPFERTLGDSACAPACMDTVPVRALFEFAWQAEPVPPATAITGYQYAFGWGQGVSVGPDVHSVSFDTRLPGSGVNPGVATFTLRATDDLGGATELIRWIRLGFSPDTWFAGPDPSSIAVVQGSGGQRYLQVPDWSAVPPVVRSLMSCDSLTMLPWQRPPRATFFEIYGNRLYVRSEGDTVHLGSWLVFHHGGFDPDSPYSVHVVPGTTIPGSAACAANGIPAVVLPDTANGSPIGFRLQLPIEPDFGAGTITQPSETTTYPWFDPASVFHQPAIAGYWAATISGRAYAIGRAVDGDGSVDRRIADVGTAWNIVHHVENGTATPEEMALRSKILTFYIDVDPSLTFGTPGFFPRPPQYNSGQVAGSPDRTLRLRWSATDPDPIDPSQPLKPGGPTSAVVLRYTTTVTGLGADLHPVSYHAPAVVGGTSLAQDIDLAAVAPGIISDEVTVHLQLCDCATCESLPGTGRCVDYDIPVYLEAPLGAPAPAAHALELGGLQPNPGGGLAAIAYELPDDRPATLEVFDTTGRRVWSVHTASGAGPHTMRVDRALAPGVYVIRLSHGGNVRLARAAIVR